LKDIIKTVLKVPNTRTQALEQGRGEKRNEKEGYRERGRERKADQA
jgi:hypothetical protein